MIKTAMIMHRSAVPILLFQRDGMQGGRGMAPVSPKGPSESRGIGIAAVVRDSSYRLLSVGGEQFASSLHTPRRQILSGVLPKAALKTRSK